MGKSNAGWAIMLSDFALILFILGSGRAGEGAPAAPSPQPVEQAYYRVAPGAPPIDEWLALQQMGPDARLDIRIAYGANELTMAMDQAEELAGQARDAGFAARIILDPDTRGVGATLVFDR